VLSPCHAQTHMSSQSEGEQFSKAGSISFVTRLPEVYLSVNSQTQRSCRSALPPHLLPMEGVAVDADSRGCFGMMQVAGNRPGHPIAL
jgi:hypothetical protein